MRAQGNEIGTTASSISKKFEHIFKLVTSNDRIEFFWDGNKMLYLLVVIIIFIQALKNNSIFCNYNKRLIHKLYSIYYLLNIGNYVNFILSDKFVM